jgi:RNA polymerase sigma factor (sigma-70 family)
MYSHNDHSLFRSPLRLGIVDDTGAGCEPLPLCRPDEAALVAYLFKMLGDRGNAVEVAHAAYLAVDLSPDPFGPHRRGLLFDVAAALAVDVLRRARAPAIAALFHEPPTLPDPHGDAAARYLAAHLGDILLSLPPRLRQPFVLRYVQQLPAREVAERLRISGRELEHRLVAALSCVRAAVEQS